MNVSHVNISQWGFSRLNLPSKVKATVNPNQYLVKMGRDLNHSWMSPPAILLPLKSFHIQFNLISKEININQCNHRRTCRQYVGELFSVWIFRWCWRVSAQCCCCCCCVVICCCVAAGGAAASWAPSRGRAAPAAASAGTGPSTAPACPTSRGLHKCTVIIRWIC